MKNKLILDLIREIKTNPGRFLSIFFIVLLGTAFFSGLRSSGLAMKLSADSYYDDTSFMDGRLLSSLGFTEKELRLVEKEEDLIDVKGIKTRDAFLIREDKEFLVKAMPYTKEINQPFLLEGRLPQKRNECLIDEKLAKDEGLSPGDPISLKSGSKRKLSRDLSQTDFVISGFCYLPYYLEEDRGTSKIGDGSIDSFLLLPEEVFVSDIYSEIQFKIKGAEAYVSYSESYKNHVSPVLKKLEDLEDTLSESRYHTIFKDAQNSIQKNEKKIKDGEQKLSDARKKIEDGERTLKKEKDHLDQQESDLKKSGMLSFVLPKIEAARKELLKEEKKLKKARKEFNEKEKKETKKINDGKEKLKKAKKDLEELSPPEIFTLGRDKMPSFVSFEQNANRMDNIGNVFPVIFFLVAALVSLTAMTRMVDENRINMGTLKALGFPNRSIILKYLLYSVLATLSGSLIGIVLGERYFPLLILTSYRTLFIGMPYALTPPNYKQAFLALFVALFSTGGATIASSYKCLREVPASMMRPVPPRHGKRVLLEHLPFLWKRLNFTGKSTIRNLARYKKRLIMTVIGIGGCMGLLLVGFGLRDSIQEIADKQYQTIFTYDARIILDTKAKKAQKEELFSEITYLKGLHDPIYVSFQTIDLGDEHDNKQVYLFIPEKTDDLDRYVIIRDYKTKEALPFPKNGVYITEKIAKMLNLKVGETIVIGEKENKKITAKIDRIVENYMFHYLFLSPETYQSLFEKKPSYNNLFLSYSENIKNERDFSQNLLAFDACTGVYFTSELQEQIEIMLRVLNLVILVLIGSAGLLAFVVLYNLNSINVMERKRELATLKVLGFYDGEVSSYVYRENVILTVFGILAGMLFGYILHRFVIVTVEIDLMMFGRTIRIYSYLISILITFFFSFLVNFIMHFMLKRINMIESLKSIE